MRLDSSVGKYGKTDGHEFNQSRSSTGDLRYQPEPLEELAKSGAIIKSKPSEIPPCAEVIFLALPSHVVVEEVMSGSTESYRH